MNNKGPKNSKYRDWKTLIFQIKMPENCIIAFKNYCSTNKLCRDVVLSDFIVKYLEHIFYNPEDIVFLFKNCFDFFKTLNEGVNEYFGYLLEKIDNDSSIDLNISNHRELTFALFVPVEILECIDWLCKITERDRVDLITQVIEAELNNIYLFSENLIENKTSRIRLIN